MPKLYTMPIPVTLQLEADTSSEARAEMLKLYREVMANLPTGAGCFVKDATWQTHVRDTLSEV